MEKVVVIANLLHNQFPGHNVLLSMPSPLQIPTPHTKIGFDNLGFTRKGDQLTELSPTPAGLRLSETTITCYPEACVPKPIYCSRRIMYEFCNHHDQTLLSSSIYPRFNFYHCRQLLAAGPSLLLSQTHDRLAQYAIAKQLTEGIPLIIQPKSQLKLYILFKYLSIKLSFRCSRRQFLVLLLRLRLLLRLLSLQLQRSPRTLFSRTSSRSRDKPGGASFSWMRTMEFWMRIFYPTGPWMMWQPIWMKLLWIGAFLLRTLIFFWFFSFFLSDFLNGM